MVAKSSKARKVLASQAHLSCGTIKSTCISSAGGAASASAGASGSCVPDVRQSEEDVFLFESSKSWCASARCTRVVSYSYTTYAVGPCPPDCLQSHCIHSHTIFAHVNQSGFGTGFWGCSQPVFVCFGSQVMHATQCHW
eukprot:2208691-Amphidinium_carterae.1